MLSAFIEERHNNRDAACLAADSGDNTFEILKVIIRRHVIGLSTQRIGQGIVGNVNQNV